jgi:hypothetical protein
MTVAPDLMSEFATTVASNRATRYSLLGPDYHRLDRASFAWRTYSITSSRYLIAELLAEMRTRFATLPLATPRQLGSQDPLSH